MYTGFLDLFFLCYAIVDNCFLEEVCILHNGCGFDLCFQIEVRHMAAGTADAIGTEEDGRYSSMWVITSDLPGMGKTRFVQKFAENHHVSGTTFTQLAQIALSGCINMKLRLSDMKSWGS